MAHPVSLGLARAMAPTLVPAEVGGASTQSGLEGGDLVSVAGSRVRVVALFSLLIVLLIR